MSNLSPRWPRPRDLPVYVVPAVIAFLQVMGTLGANAGEGQKHAQNANHLDPLAFGLLLAGPAALLARRRYPVPTLLVVGAVTLLYFLRVYPNGPAPLSFGIAIIAAVVAGHRVWTWITGAAVWSAYALAAALFGEEGDPEKRGGIFPLEPPTYAETGGRLAWTIAFILGAEVVRIRAERMAEAERVRQEEERRRAGEERLRIARELHDVLAHNISMINVQAGVALHLMDDNPEQARTALAAIKDASKDALTEVRSVLGVLRQVDEEAPRAPTAGLERLNELVERTRAAGLQVRSDIEGTPRPIPAGLDLAAFRIVQEALTNATRHAGAGASVRIRIAYEPEELVLQIRDNGRGQPDAVATVSGSGSGIAGMRERAAALGGELVAGPRPGSGFQVRARLPIENGTADAGTQNNERSGEAK